MNNKFPMDFFVLSKSPIEGEPSTLGLGVYSYPGSDSLKIILAPSTHSPAIFAAPIDDIEVVHSFSDAVEKYECQNDFLTALGQIVLQNYPGFCEDWGHKATESGQPAEDLKNQLHMMLTSGVTSAFAFQEDKLIGIMLDHGPRDGIHFPHFALVDKMLESRGVARLLASTLLEEAGLVITRTRNPTLIQAAERRITAYSSKFSGPEVYAYLYPIPVYLEEFSPSETASPSSLKRQSSSSLVLCSEGAAKNSGKAGVHPSM